MQYDVAALSAGEVVTAQVEARVTAAAVAAVQEDRASRGAFQPLSVVPAAAPEASQTADAER